MSALTLDRLHKYPQAITSARTTRRQIAAAWHLAVVNIARRSTVLDFGGGKFDDAATFAREHGIDARCYDPYNRSAAENAAALASNYSAIVCSNVLNILTDDVIGGAIADLALCRNGSAQMPVFVSVYERDKSGVGCLTGPDQWQRNEPIAAYLPRLHAVFRHIEIAKKVALCR